MHPNSRKIKIYRATSFMDDAQVEAAPDFVANSDKSIGPYFIKGSKQMGSGLEPEELDILLPRLIDYTAKDRDFLKEARKYYDSLRTKIPYEGGKEFEIGLKTDNDKPVSDDNLPINIDDYVRYRHALKSPQVAPDRESSFGNQNIWFYVSDPQQERQRSLTASSQKDEAMTIYLGLKNDKDKVDMYLTLMGVDPRGEGNAGERQTALRNLADSRPADFIRVHKDENFEMRYLVQSFINTGVFSLVENRIVVDSKTKKIIGQTIDEAIIMIQADDKKEALSIWKMEMQEALKKKIGKRTAPRAANTRI